MFSDFISKLSYFNLVMSYSFFSETSREIVLFSFTYIASYLLNMSYRLIDYQSVYYDYDNSSVLLSDNICTLSSIDFYIFCNYITIIAKQSYKRIRLSDYLLDNSKLHDIVVMHLGNNIFIGKRLLKYNLYETLIKFCFSMIKNKTSRGLTTYF